MAVCVLFSVHAFELHVQEWTKITLHIKRYEFHFFRITISQMQSWAKKWELYLQEIFCQILNM